MQQVLVALDSHTGPQAKKQDISIYQRSTRTCSRLLSCCL